MSRKDQAMPAAVSAITPIDPDSPSVRLIAVAREVHTWADRLLEVAHELEEEARRERTDRGDE